MCIPCILIPLLVGLISAFLGYLLGRLLGKNEDELNSVKSELASTKLDRDKHLDFSSSLKTDVSNWKAKFDALSLETDGLKAKLSGALSNDDADSALIAKLKAELEACNAKLHASTSDDASDKATIAKLQSELDACNTRNISMNATISSLEGEVGSLKLAASAPKLIPFDAAAALAVFGKKVLQNDLKLVEGIGPKIEELFHNAGIKTWKALSETSVADCQKILDAAGERYQIHNPGTWPKQCQLMYEGKWQELKDWQDKLDGGRE